MKIYKLILLKYCLLKLLSLLVGMDPETKLSTDQNVSDHEAKQKDQVSLLPELRRNRNFFSNRNS